MSFTPTLPMLPHVSMSQVPILPIPKCPMSQCRQSHNVPISQTRKVPNSRRPDVPNSQVFHRIKSHMSQNRTCCIVPNLTCPNTCRCAQSHHVPMSQISQGQIPICPNVPKNVLVLYPQCPKCSKPSLVACQGAFGTSFVAWREHIKLDSLSSSVSTVPDVPNIPNVPNLVSSSVSNVPNVPKSTKHRGKKVRKSRFAQKRH